MSFEKYLGLTLNFFPGVSWSAADEDDNVHHYFNIIQFTSTSVYIRLLALKNSG